MTSVHVLAGGVLAAIGVAAVLVAAAQRRVAMTDAATWLASDLGGSEAVAIETGGSFVERVLRPALGRLGSWIADRTPSARLDRLHAELLHAGLASRLRAEEVFALHLLSAIAGIGAAAAWVMVAQPPTRLAVAGCIAVITAGAVVPRAWLRRQAAARQEAIFHDLPDALDLMVIGMEAGITFDGALQVVAEHLDSPLGQELGRTLAEMELGLSRRDALQNLKRRADVPELSHVVSALLQADALGMSVSRVLRVQAGEMRAKRRQWAREKAGKLPVKILFPLVAFIFPPVMVIVIGPAASDLRSLFG